MTYEERKKKYCENCFKAYPSCAYKSRNLEDKCGVLENIMNGWELGYQDAIDKAIEWIDCFCNEHYIMSYSDSHEVEINELIDIFKKKMED